MKQRRFLIAITMVLLSIPAIFAARNPSGLKYATFLPAFSIDKAWQFNSNYVSMEYTSGTSATSSNDNTTLVPFPGNIAWSINTWIDRSSSNNDYEMTSARIYLVNGSTGAEMEIAYLQFAANDNKEDHKAPEWIENANGCTTVQTNYQINFYDNHSLFNYYHTIYGDTVRDFIAAAGSNIKVKCRAHFDGGINNYYSNVLNEEDRQQIILPQPNVSDIAWTVNNNTTCVAFKPGVTAADGFKLKIEECWNTNLNSEYQSFSSNSYCYYHPAQLTNYKNNLNRYSDYFKYKLYTENTYSFSTNKYLNNASNYQYPHPTTTTIRSTVTLFNAPAFAQPENATAVDNKNGSVTLTWSNQKHQSNQAYDNSKFIIERATNSAFTENRVTHDLNLTYQTGTGSTSYTWTDNFTIRNQGNKTFYYRIYRENAQNTELNSSTSIGVNTNYATLSQFEAAVDPTTNTVNLNWGYNQGIKNSDLVLKITYNNTTITEASNSGLTEHNGITNIQECVPTTLTAQLYASNTLYSDAKTATVTRNSSNPGIIDTVITSAGYYNNRVNITWKINNSHKNFSSFQLIRKEYGDTMTTPLTTINFTPGILQYTFDDNTCIPGVYYEYKIMGYSLCDNTVSLSCEKSAIGFAQPYGVVSGQIAYSGNQAVEDVAVTAQCEGKFSGKSLSFVSSDHPKLEIPVNRVAQMLGNTAGTIEFFVRLNNTTTYNPIVDCGDRFKLSNQNDKLKLVVSSTSTEVNGALSAGTFSYIAITYDNQNTILYLNGEAIDTMSVSLQSLQAIKFGFDNTGYMTGNLDEIRVWNTTRTPDEIRRYMNAYLTGTEEGLTAYYRCDDNINTTLFDLSKTGNNFNGRHLRMDNITIDDLSTPTYEQLGLKAYTNQYGNYLFNNIPYSTEGTLYNIIPMLGIHEFSPAQRPLFFNSTAVTHNAVDFEDVSSFPVSGKVTFANTNYPVEGCQFYIDGTTLCTSEGETIETDAKGEYTISVPIGAHYITIKKNGHTFANNGRYPATGRLDFQNAVTNLSFQDSTFVLVTGRIAGGSDEAEKPHGFGKGKATIGQARISLGTRGDLYNLNLDENNPRTFTMPADSLYGSCNSVATTGRAYQNLAHDITILTDPSTGEFNVMLPPIDFVVKNVELINNGGNITFNLSSVSGLSLGSQEIGNITTDSVAVDSTGYNYFSYSAALDVIHYAEPTMTIQQSEDDMALGSPSFIYENKVLNITDTVPLYTIDTFGNITYKFGYPCFSTDDIVGWKIKAFETYVNYDNQDTTRQPFRYGIVSVANNFGKQVKNSLSWTDTTITTAAYQTVYVNGPELMLDNDGTTYYSFQVGEPNVMPPFTSTFMITYQDGQRTRHYNWNGNSNGRNKVIVLGSKVTGTNFVTKGPDEIFYILRDPLGSGAYATWEAGETVTKTLTNTNQNSRSESLNITISVGNSFYNVAAPMGVGTASQVSTIHTHGPFETYSGSTQWKKSKTWTFTNSQTISTGSATSLNGSKGDVFIGSGTNRLYGDAKNVYIKRDVNGNYSIDIEDALSVSTEFTTQFNYSQENILENMLPSLKKLRNQLLTQVPVAQFDTSFVNYTDSAIYITALAETAPNYGENGTYYMILPEGWKTDPDDNRKFEDEVYSYNNQIRRWMDVLIHNERCKVMVHNSTQPFDREAWEQAVYESSNEMFHSITDDPLDTADLAGDFLDKVADNYTGGWLINNYSLGGMGNISCSETRSYSAVGNGFSESDGFVIGVKNNNSTTILGNGVTFDWDVSVGETWTSESSTDTSRSSTVSYHVQIDRDDALSFDVYQAPDGYGPIFAVRGGQTSCPYQKGEMTKFYEPGQHELQTATVPSYWPQITVHNPVLSNIPVGKRAIFNLEMANVGTAKYLSYFKLRSLAGTNPTSATLIMGGDYITDAGYSFPYNGSDPVSRMLELIPIREDILDYDSIGIVFSTDCNIWDADTVYISAHFVQTCSDINLSADMTTINNTTGNTVAFTIDGFEQDFRNLAGIQLQYQSAGSNQWSLLKQFPADSAAVIHYSHTFTKPQYPDGIYKFRAVTLCQYGNETINNESEEVTVVVDVAAPEALGQPYPIDGLYTANNQVYVDFNESIQTGRVLSDNVIVEGVLNAHQVNHSVSLNLENNTAVSNATYKLGSTPFTLELWLNYSQPGTIFSYAAGTNSGIEFAIDASGHMTATINGTTYTSAATMMPNRWSFIVIQCDVNNKILDATYSYDDQNVTLFYGQVFTLPASSGNIRFGGNGLNAKIHDVALWKRIRSTAESLAERSESKSPYTPDVMSLWQMNEGKGTIAKDNVRQRHLTLTDDAWVYNHVNYAMHVAAGDSAMVNISECSIAQDKSYLFEMWFRAAGNAELFHLANGSFATSISNGNLVIENHTMPMRNYQANTWHHLAIINSNISTPVIAIDGEQLSSPSLRTLPAFASSYVVFGNTTNSSNIDIDEVRLWNINTTLQATKLQSGNCLTGEEDGLLAYYPMEAYYTDPISSQISTVFSLTDKTDIEKALVHSNEANAQSTSVPALVESRPLEYVAHTHTTSDNRIVVNVTEPAARIEGCWLEITVKDIVDANGNYSAPIRWTAYVNRNQLIWDENTYSIVKDEIADTTFTLTILNNSSVIQNWNIDNIPSCMTLSETSGHINPLQTKTITCTIDATADRGETEYTLYLRGNENMDCPLYITTKVYANKPNWNINPSWYEHSMNIIAYAEVDGVVADDSEDMIAAYVNGQLAGVAHPQLLPAMGRYYMMMTIFQNTPQNATTPRYVTFRYWDASTGLVYSNAQIYSTSNSGTTYTLLNNIAYQDNLVLGTTTNPIRLVMGNDVEQTLDLNQGWNWVSFNVNPASISFTSILGAYVKKFSIIKSQTEYGVPDTATHTVRGTIDNLDCKLGYKIKTYNSFDVRLTGMPVSLNQTIGFDGNKWTWFGYLPQKAMTTNSALSNINPSIGDIVKSLTQFATWDGYQWVGSLKVMCPGQSYIYYNNSSSKIYFTYPDYADVPYLMPSMFRSSAYYFNTVDPGDYQGNMNITATVTKDGNEVTTAEIGVFAGTECHGAATYDDGYYFITVSGDTCTPLTIKVLYNDSIYTLQGNLLYQNDAVVGSITTPFVIDLTTGQVPDVPSDPNDPYDPNNRENPGDNPGGDNPGENPGENPQVSVVNVEAANGSKVEKVLIENEVFIIKDGQMYDALGRRRK